MKNAASINQLTEEMNAFSNETYYLCLIVSNEFTNLQVVFHYNSV